MNRPDLIRYMIRRQKSFSSSNAQSRPYHSSRHGETTLLRMRFVSELSPSPCPRWKPVFLNSGNGLNEFQAGESTAAYQPPRIHDHLVLATHVWHVRSKRTLACRQGHCLCGQPLGLGYIGGKKRERNEERDGVGISAGQEQFSMQTRLESQSSCLHLLSGKGNARQQDQGEAGGLLFSTLRSCLRINQVFLCAGYTRRNSCPKPWRQNAKEAQIHVGIGGSLLKGTANPARCCQY
jgi:hypothetical protein